MTNCLPNDPTTTSPRNRATAPTNHRPAARGRLTRVAVVAALAAGVIAVGTRGPVQAQQVSANRAFIAVMCQFAGNTSTYGITPATIDTMLNGSPYSLDGYVREMSLGAANTAGSRAAGWFTLSKAKSAYPTDWGGSETLIKDCAAAAVAGGVDLTPFRNIIVYVNDVLPSGASGSTQGVSLPVGGQEVPFTAVLLNRRGLNSPPLLLHELGHVFGGKHTRSVTDPLGAGAWFGENPQFYSGAPLRTVNIGPGWDASNRDAAGWIAADRKTTVAEGTQTITLTRLTQPLPTGMMLVNVPIGATGERYVVSARTRVGYDAQTQAPGTQQFGYMVPTPGVVIEKVSPTADTITMFSTPGGSNESAAAIWSAGQTFTDPSGIRITVDRFDDNGAQVTVTNGGAAPATTTTAAPATVAPTTAAPAPVTTAPPAAPQTTAAAVTTAAPVTAAPPVATGGLPTDAFAAAPVITAPTTVATFSNAGFGREDGEPSPCAGIGSTVWFKIPAPASGVVTISTSGSSFDTVLAAYTGPATGATFASLANLTCVDDTPGSSQALIRGPVAPGQTIYVQAGGYGSATGNLVITVS